MSFRRMFVGLATGVSLALAASAVSAQTWVYDETDGGWKDTQTGLVWHQLEVDYYFAAVATVDAMVVNGFDDWRLPTFAELETAYAHDIAGSDVPLYGNPLANYFWWSTDGRGKAWRFNLDLRYGGFLKTWVKNSRAPVIAVRQGTPVP